ncbi:Serine/threonine protein kinase [Fictibacillus macauensis ZFHKF-1]|uniref:Serine/threonine protein kinase n=1 Tax=Fictibacillus macauensis ZFHKF-1 TaxID=1196324 RepID=I8UCM9_9BACL|nr:hypothetical protein [Fictibacillus macauensis]EIT84533.1 Serine/threonine protein kinase [Fictibacillus macauensis ZFHKF-1]
MQPFEDLAEQLVQDVTIVSVQPTDPVVVKEVPTLWEVIGCGNYAAVFSHPSYENYVVKVYVRNEKERILEELAYKKLGDHPHFSKCYGRGDTHLILKRIKGMTLFDCLQAGIRIPQQVIEDVDCALYYAREQGLQPSDVHGKNIMIENGRGVVVDVSDFFSNEECQKWDDLKQAYYKLYVPLLYKHPRKVPKIVLNGIRIGYRLYRTYIKRKKH